MTQNTKDEGDAICEALIDELKDAITSYNSAYGHQPLYLHLPKWATALLTGKGYPKYPSGNQVTALAEALASMLRPTKCHYRGHVFNMMLISNPRMVDSLTLSNHIVSTPNDGSRSITRGLACYEFYKSAANGKALASAT